MEEAPLSGIIITGFLVSKILAELIKFSLYMVDPETSVLTFKYQFRELGTGKPTVYDEFRPLCT